MVEDVFIDLLKFVVVEHGGDFKFKSQRVKESKSQRDGESMVNGQ